MSLADLIERAFAPSAASIRDGNIPGAVLGAVTADGARAVHWNGWAQIEPERFAAGEPAAEGLFNARAPAAPRR